ncbi:Methionine aminopeptidase 1D, chloroplastic/mitochondrial [Vitis vinifera]|uniref:Methionine aminopeptidase 1D, chloroplastic/mitochondrial n=1 Tax=Vitis vinifera TaxID=29760 RepID=A0A438KJ47_VITVI|nr:Methionine aminopeptidase 1D, chloroplastic/mitochondrial [Vitis vinifera]
MVGASSLQPRLLSSFVGDRFVQSQRPLHQLFRCNPGHILRPSYVTSKKPPGIVSGPEVHDEKGIECMRNSGRLAAQVLEYAGTLVKPGIKTDEIDEAVHQMIIDNDSRPLEDGDIINIDVTVYLNGYHGDTSATFFCGDVDDKARKLVEVVFWNFNLNKVSLLDHGEPAGFFPSSKGLRQGDPLSPYLFIMGMKVLSALIRRAVEGSCITGCRIQRAASGLRINLAKSEIIPVGEVDEILEMAVELGCKVGQLPSTYLGLPLGAPNKAGYVWDGVEERMRWKLALWKRQYLSKGGSGEKTRKLQRDFLWGGGSTERKAHLVNWERVCVSKEKGGLGLRKLVHLNKALLGKWVWRFARAKEEMWKRVLVAKYGQEEFGWRTKKTNGAFGVGLWKEILKEADWCWNNMILKVGKGTKIRFWKDPWCGDVELARRFPQLFNVAAQKSATVGDLWDQNAGPGGWNLRFIRGFNDWELTWLTNCFKS